MGEGVSSRGALQRDYSSRVLLSPSYPKLSSSQFLGEDEIKVFARTFFCFFLKRAQKIHLRNSFYETYMKYIVQECSLLSIQDINTEYTSWADLFLPKKKSWSFLPHFTILFTYLVLFAVVGSSVNFANPSFVIDQRQARQSVIISKDCPVRQSLVGHSVIVILTMRPSSLNYSSLPLF